MDEFAPGPELPALLGIASRQRGLVTAAQASRAGATAELDQLRTAGLVVELGWRVYQLPGSPLGVPYAYPYAAWLALAADRFAWERPPGAGDAVLSHESACQLHRLGSIPAPRLVFTAPEPGPPLAGVTVRTAELTPADITVVKGIPVTTPHRSLLDLATVTSDLVGVGAAITDAVTQDLVDLARLHADLVQLAAEHDLPTGGRRFLRLVLPDLPVESLSDRNARAYAGLSEDAGHPLPERFTTPIGLDQDGNLEPPLSPAEIAYYQAVRRGERPPPPPHPGRSG